MNIRDLEYLVKLAELKHFSKAAEACFITQPTLSAQLKKLSDELNLQLIESNKKLVQFTPQGLKIVEQAKRVLQETKALKQLAQNLRDPFSGDFRIAAIPTLGPYLFPKIIKALQKTFPKAKFWLYELKTKELLSELAAGNIDAGLLALPIEAKKIKTISLFKEPFNLALPAQHPLSKKEKISLHEVADNAWLLLEEGHCLRDQALEICNNFGIQENVTYRATSLETLRNMIAMNHGISLLPALASHPQKGLAIKKIKPKAPSREIVLSYREEAGHSELAQAVAKVIRDNIGHLDE